MVKVDPLVQERYSRLVAASRDAYFVASTPPFTLIEAEARPKRAKCVKILAWAGARLRAVLDEGGEV